MVKKIFAYSYLYLILFLLYLPIFVIIIFSFSADPQLGTFSSGFTFQLYADLFKDEAIMKALGNTLILAVVSAIVSTLIGACGAIGAFYSKKRTRAILEGLNQIPVVNAEIVMALSLTVMFAFISSTFFGGKSIFSFFTLLIGHCVLCVPFVYINVKPKLMQMDSSLYEAALDLGASPRKALRKVVIPQILPGIMSGFMLSLTLSLDDFIITAFTRGSGLLSGEGTIETLSTYVQAKIKKGGIPPALRALTTLIFLIALSIVIGQSIYNNVKAKKIMKARRRLS